MEMKKSIELKNYLVLDEAEIRESLNAEDGLKKLSLLSDKADEWKERFTCQKDRSALENFLLYRTAGAFGLYQKDADDADITPPALEALKERLYALPCVQAVKVGKENGVDEKDRIFHVYLGNGKDIWLESDTANSLMGDLGKFFKIILKREWKNRWWPEETYIKKYDLDPDRRKQNQKIDDVYYKPFRYFYFSELISSEQIVDMLENDMERECYAQIEERAKLTHTPANMILVPYWHNAARGFKLKTYETRQTINDRLDLTMQDFQEMEKETDAGNALNVEDRRREELRNAGCRKGLEKFTAESVKFLMNHKELLFPAIPVFKGAAEQMDIQGILERSRAINRTLKG